MIINLIITIFCIVIFFFVFKNIPKNKKQTRDNCNEPKKDMNLEVNAKKEIHKEKTHVISDLQKLSDYYSFGLSVQGKSHKKKPILPCQDYHAFGTINEQFHYAIVSDGAGSASNSHFGSKLACETLSKLLLKYLETIDPTDFKTKNEWYKDALSLFENTRIALENHSEENEIDFDSLKCTMLLIIQTPLGILSANIGDGRAGCLKSNKYYSLMVPFQTFVVGSTFFITSDNWDQFFRTDTFDITDPDALFAISDGCDDFSFLQKGPVPKHELGVYDKVYKDARYDHNQPFPGFFDAFIGQMKELVASNKKEDITMVTEEIIDLGIFKGKSIEGIQKEEDDKTMVMFFKA